MSTEICLEFSGISWPSPGETVSYPLVWKEQQRKMEGISCCAFYGDTGRHFRDCLFCIWGEHQKRNRRILLGGFLVFTLVLSSSSWTLVLSLRIAKVIKRSTVCVFVSSPKCVTLMSWGASWLWTSWFFFFFNRGTTHYTFPWKFQGQCRKYGLAISLILPSWSNPLDKNLLSKMKPLPNLETIWLVRQPQLFSWFPWI